MGDISVGAVGAALVAGIVSFITLVMGKEQKISEFRQTWIEDLRKCLVDYLVNINALSDLIRLEKAGKHSDIPAQLAKLQALNQARHGIELRINGNEKQARRLLKSMSEFDALGQNSANFTPDRLRAIEVSFLKSSRKLLKFEWNRVKRGEQTFVWSKRAFGLLTVLSIICAAYLDVRSNLTNNPATQSISERLPFFAR